MTRSLVVFIYLVKEMLVRFVLAFIFLYCEQRIT